MVAFKYTPEMTEWVHNNCAGREWEDVAVSFNQKFGLCKTARQFMRSDAKKTLELWETKLTQEEREKAMSTLLLSKVFADRIMKILLEHADKDDDDQLVCDIYKASIAYCDTSKSLKTEFDKNN